MTYVPEYLASEHSRVICEARLDGWLVAVVNNGLTEDERGTPCEQMTVKIYRLDEDGLPADTWGIVGLRPLGVGSRMEWAARALARGEGFVDGWRAAHA